MHCPSFFHSTPSPLLVVSLIFLVQVITKRADEPTFVLFVPAGQSFSPKHEHARNSPTTTLRLSSRVCSAKFAGTSIEKASTKWLAIGLLRSIHCAFFWYLHSIDEVLTVTRWRVLLDLDRARSQTRSTRPSSQFRKRLFAFENAVYIFAKPNRLCDKPASEFRTCRSCSCS
jgi:hypothetical protein